VNSQTHALAVLPPGVQPPVLTG